MPRPTSTDEGPSYLFDTNAVSEVFKARPREAFLTWLDGVPLERQYTSAVTIGELYKGAFRSQHLKRYLEFIEVRLLPNLTVLPYDAAVARHYGQVLAALQAAGTPIEDADVQIAATAIHHGLELVTGNLAHYSRVPGLRLCPVLADAKRAGTQQ